MTPPEIRILIIMVIAILGFFAYIEFGDNNNNYS